MFRVLDFTRVLAGPWATQVLGDQGFDVIKVEGPDGDETRAFAPIVDGESVYFACTNRNKRGIVLDLKTPAGVEVARRLAAGADVVVENFRPGVMRRLGLDPVELRAANPALVVASISAFGDGPWADRAGYDLVVQAMSGIASLTGDPPRKAGPSIADLSAAQVAVQGILFALLERSRTGLGTHVEVRMIDVAHHLLAYYASAWMNAGREPPAPGNAHPSIAPYNLYRTADGWLAICCANEGLWRAFRDAVGLEARPAWATLAGRVADRDALDGAIEAVLVTAPTESWEARLSAAGVPCGPARSVPEALSHPMASRVRVGRWEQPAPPLPARALRPPPGLGEHTDAVLAEAGYDAAQIAALRAAGAFGR